MKKEKISKEEEIKAKYEAKLLKLKEKEALRNETKEEKLAAKANKKKINLPNKLTMFRIFLVPLFIVAMVLTQMNIWKYLKYIALGIFVVAAVTDYVDGYIARKKNLVTRFGKLMDPLADKMLVSAGFIMLTGSGMIPAWITAIVILRDFVASTIRMFGTEGGVTISADFSGKVKTAFQLIGVSLAIIDTNALFGFIQNTLTMGFGELLLNVATSVAISVAVFFAIWSIIEYLIKYRKHINIHE